MEPSLLKAIKAEALIGTNFVILHLQLVKFIVSDELSS
jgi:hypothetical protein